MKKINNIIATALLGVTLITTSALAENKKPIELGHNAVEIGLTDSNNIRARLHTNIDVKLGEVQLGYHGMNEMTSNTDTYFGRNVLTASIKGSDTSLASIGYITQEGIINERFGLRNTSIPRKIGDYGFIDAAINEDSAEISALIGKVLPQGFSAEIYNSTTKLFEGGTTNYTELQINKKITNNASLFYRVEGLNYDKNTATHLGCLVFNF